MSLLLDKKELKKEAKSLSIEKLNEAVSTLNEVLSERAAEALLLKEIRALAESRGYKLESLLSNSTLDAQPTEQKDSVGRPNKPKLKSVNNESQFFYVENGKLNLLKTHTMKKGLVDRGIDVFPYHKLNANQLDDAAVLLKDASEQALHNYNSKVDVWNEWAQAHGEEILSKR